VLSQSGEGYKKKKEKGDIVSDEIHKEDKNSNKFSYEVKE
jgi:hypothetical protein